MGESGTDVKQWGSYFFVACYVSGTYTFICLSYARLPVSQRRYFCSMAVVLIHTYTGYLLQSRYVARALILHRIDGLFYLTPSPGPTSYTKQLVYIKTPRPPYSKHQPRKSISAIFLLFFPNICLPSPSYKIRIQQAQTSNNNSDKLPLCRHPLQPMPHLGTYTGKQ